MNKIITLHLIFMFYSNSIAQNVSKWETYNDRLIFINFQRAKPDSIIFKALGTIYYSNKLVVYLLPDKFAEFPGGSDEMQKFIKKNLQYPKTYYGISPGVFVSFIVLETGEICYIGIDRGMDYEHDKNTIELIKKMPKWKPAIKNGFPVNSLVMLPIKFEI